MKGKFKYITRAQVLKAIRTEPLRAGSWFRRAEFWVDDPFIGDRKSICSVCAVGAVIRTAFPKVRMDAAENLIYSNIIGTYDGNGNVEKQVRSKDYLGALSTFFEQAMRKGTFGVKSRVSRNMRQRLVDFVKENFPARIRLNTEILDVK